MHTITLHSWMTKTLIIIAVAIVIACQSKPRNTREEILKILEIQENYYGHQTEEGKPLFIKTCVDSLIFIGGDDGGMMTTAKGYANDLADGYVVKPYDRKITIYPSTVIVTSLHQAYKILVGDTLYINVRTTKIFVDQNGEWKMAYFTYAPIPVNYFQTVRADYVTLQKYVGLYDAGNNHVDSVYLSDNKLFVNGSELLPVNDSTFIGSDYFGKSIFAKDHYTFEWIDGQRIRFRKLR